MGFLVANPDIEEMKCISRLAIHQDYKNQYPDLGENKLDSFIAFDFDMNDLVIKGTYIHVLELRNSALSEAYSSWDKMKVLSYLGLRGCKISSLPKIIGDFEDRKSTRLNSSHAQ